MSAAPAGAPLLRLLLLVLLLLLCALPSAGRGRKKSKRLKQPPPFDCAVSEWSAPTPQEAAEIDLGADYCDFERLDEAPTYEQFVETIWQRKPVLIRNYTGRFWPRAAERWMKRHLWERYGAREVDSFDSDAHDVTVSAATRLIRSVSLRLTHVPWLAQYTDWVPRKLHEFLANEVCAPASSRALSPTEQMHQEYVFDRDGLFEAVPELLYDYSHPPFIERQFNA